MGRGKSRLKLIENPLQRRVMLGKRGDGLRKKASELATLCDIDVCVLVYGEEGESSSQPQDPDQATVYGEDGGSSSQPVVWPEDQEAVRVVIERFKSMPEADQRSKMLDGASLLRERVAKLQQQVRKAESHNRELETKLLLHDAIDGRPPGLAGLTMQQLGRLDWMAKDRAKKIRERIAQLRGQQPPPPYATTGADVDSPPPPPQGWPIAGGSQGRM